MNTSLGNFELFSDWLFCSNYRMWQHHRIISGVILRIKYDNIGFWKYMPTKLQMEDVDECLGTSSQYNEQVENR